MANIELKNIFKAYNGNAVLSGFSYKFERNKSYIVSGESGSGKTTLINIIAGLVAPDSGDVAARQNISMVFQEDRLLENLSVRANINAVLKEKIDGEKLDYMLSSLNLSGCAKKPARELSGGMKRRTAILRALAADFEVLIMDEPFNGLDENTKKITAEFIKNYIGGKIFIFVSHGKDDEDLFGSENVSLR